MANGYQDDTKQEGPHEATIDYAALREASLAGLTDTQREAVTAGPGPMLLLAGAGTGKTRCLTARIGWNIGVGTVGLPHVLAITFTRKASREMKHRLALMMGPAAQSMFVGTFHSICIRLLRDNAEFAGISSRFTIIDDDEQLKIIKDICLNDEGVGLGVAADEISFASVRDAIDAARNGDGSKTAWEELRANEKAWKTAKLIDSGAKMRLIVEAYDRIKKEAEVLDYNDIILKTVQLLQDNTGVREYYQNMWRMILIDEYQDTNTAQEKLIALLLNKERNITCVGDEDQAVYGWRGADIKNILTFEHRYAGAKVIKLEQNFRSTSSILNAANALISKNRDRLGKTLYTVSESGATLRHDRFSDDKAEANYIVQEIRRLNSEGVPFGSIAVLGRYSHMILPVQMPLAQARIPFTVTAGKKVQSTQDIQNIVAYYRFAKNRTDDFALQRIITCKSRGMGTQKMKMAHDEARSKRIPLVDAITQLIAANEIKGKVAEGMNELLSFLEELADDYTLEAPPMELFDRITVEMGLDEDLAAAKGKANTTKNPDARGKQLRAVEKRQERLHDLRIAIQTADNLDEFVDAMALDPMEDEEATAGVWLGTVHAAKGLEFDHVILPGWTDGVFPSSRILERIWGQSEGPALDQAKAELEEERRLAYVALTRGKKSVSITSTEYRMGTQGPPSRFLGEISRKLVKEPVEPVETETARAA
ncbi:ATP-dependent helicase [Microvirga tunisiensis]|uniref:DNA 3'-5' helicase n=1 Tax=Microvirga tunisiensis TaxID=2108360 RepID=A0A5N7MAC0_9HYPH|nr:UvrD-helicase domain-containing protein [Microvirga tunisiensis]MPR05671.1 AAA family ATPase [Microvirga tunisiensis]MPR23871.1 AAA family ATPase [Microvirga tunisiensis]